MFANVSCCFWNWPPQWVFGNDALIPIEHLRNDKYLKQKEWVSTVSPSSFGYAKAIGQAKAHSFMADQETKYEATEASVRQGETPSLLNMSKERHPMNIGSATPIRGSRILECLMFLGKSLSMEWIHQVRQSLIAWNPINLQTSEIGKWILRGIPRWVWNKHLHGLFDRFGDGHVGH